MVTTNKQKSFRKTIKKIIRCWQLYLLLLLPIIYLVVFCYYPMFGAQIAFRNFSIRGGIWGSEWVGLKHFKRFLNRTNSGV